MAATLSLHLALALVPAKTKNTAAPLRETETTVVNLSLPPENEEPLLDAASESGESLDQLAPPQLVDVPGVVQVDSFIQPIQPAPPPLIAEGSLVVPLGVQNASDLARGGSRIFDLTTLDEAPVPRARMSPSYPPELRRAGVQGEVIVQFIVDAQGDVSGIEVVETTHRGFEEAAINTVRRWKFKPGRKGGSAVATRMEQSIEFALGG